jgi:hypothetical protein
VKISFHPNLHLKNTLKIRKSAIAVNTATLDGQTFAGLAIVILGRSNFTNIDVSTAVSGPTMRRIYSGVSYDSVGSSLGGAGDVNADGFLIF